MSATEVPTLLCLECRHPHRLHGEDGCGRRSCVCEQAPFRTSTTRPTAHRLAMIEVAERGLNRRSVTTGIGYARRDDQDAKRVARRRLRGLWNRNTWPRVLSILTMPGLYWEFETALLSNREGGPTIRGERSSDRTDFIHSVTRRTRITAIERDPTVFLGALRAMPGAKQGISDLEPAPFASRSMKSPLIQRFHLAEIERFLLVADHPYDAMWLDFNGPLTDARIEGIRRIWGLGLVRTHLAVTLLAARQTVDYDAGRAIDLLRSVCPQSELVDAFHYQSGRSPMSQLVLGRVS